MLNHLLGAAAMVAVVLSLSALAQATGTQGSVKEVREGGEVVLSTSDGKTKVVAVSGVRTKITVGGQAGSLDSVKVGMTCTALGAEGADAAKLDCTKAATL